MSNKERHLPPLKRRQLLKLGVTGIAALTARGVAARPDEGQTPGSGQGPAPPRPPQPDAVVNLDATSIEDWSEPWIWRPSDWPDRSLELNIVGNAHPPRAVSPGNRYTPLFSFNGSSPGPTIRMRGDERLRITLRNHLGPTTSIGPKGPAPHPFEVHPDVLAAAFCRIQTAAGRPCTAPPATADVFDTFTSSSPAALSKR